MSERFQFITVIVGIVLVALAIGLPVGYIFDRNVDTKSERIDWLENRVASIEERLETQP